MKCAPCLTRELVAIGLEIVRADSDLDEDFSGGVGRLEFLRSSTGFETFAVDSVKRDVDATGPDFVCLLLNCENLECGSILSTWDMNERAGVKSFFWSREAEEILLTKHNMFVFHVLFVELEFQLQPSRFLSSLLHWHLIIIFTCHMLI